MDVIVQDWFWWLHEGDPIFNSNFPDVPGEFRFARRARPRHALGMGTFRPGRANSQPWSRIISMFPRHTFMTPPNRQRAIFTGTTFRQALCARVGYFLAG